MSHLAPVQVYGQFGNYWSNDTVSRGIAAGLSACGVPVQIWDREGKYEGIYIYPDSAPIETGMGNGGAGVYVGYPHFSRDLLRGHSPQIGFFIAESSVIPREWGLAAAECDLVVVPSYWTRAAYVNAGVPAQQVMVVPHGLHPCYREGYNCKQLLQGRAYNFLHIAGARDFIARKGTPTLIEVFAKVAREEAERTEEFAQPWNLKLTIRTPPSPEIDQLVNRFDPDHQYIILDYHDAPLPPEEMTQYLGRGWAGLIQPSRAEAFGMCPVEARACSVPVILTAGHGHTMHVEHTVDEVVEMGAEASIKVNGIPGGQAPTFTAVSLEAALRNCLGNENHEGHIERAIGLVDGYYNRWAWPKLMLPVAAWLRKGRRR